jgi:hypothetical protein
VRSSNAGQLLFTGICRPDRAARVVQQLFGRDFFSGWGVRTLGAREKRFNPTSYHNGSVWPHDNALIGLGLAQYGHSNEALMLNTALFDAAAATVILRRPCLPAFLEWLTVRDLRVGNSKLDLMFRRHESSVAVNLLHREGDAEVEVML